MKKKEILEKLDEIIHSNFESTVSYYHNISLLIDNIKKDMQCEREFLTPLEAITKLYKGEAKKVTWIDGFYCCINQYGYLTFLICPGAHRSDIKPNMNKDTKWWVVE